MGPGLYSPEELGALLAPLQEAMAAEGGVDGPFAFFVSRVQRYLHVCLLPDGALGGGGAAERM